MHFLSSMQFSVKEKSQQNPKRSQNNKGQSNFKNQQSTKYRKCYRCGRRHDCKKCPAVNWKCFNCDRTGHTSNCDMQDLKVENKHIKMEIDTGACHSIISADGYRSNNKTKGKIKVCVEFANRIHMLDLVVIESKNYIKPLLGRAWLDILTPDWRGNIFGKNELNMVNTVETNFIDYIKTNFSNIVQPQLNPFIKDFKISIILKENSTPIFHRPYTVPLGIKQKVEQELERLCKMGILVPIKSSAWASPIVSVLKPTGEIRICMDYRVTINKYIVTEHYPLPHIDEIFTNLTNCSVFCLIDLSGAYQQLLVVEKCREYLTINAHKGLFQYTRLPFGLSNAPRAFQSIMDKILGGLEKVFCYIDDILIDGTNFDDCKNKYWC